MSRRLIYVSLSVVVVMWGGAFVAIKILLRHASAPTIALFRFSLTTAGLVLITAFLRPPRRPIAGPDRKKIVLMGLCGVSGYHLSLNFGERFVSANVAALIVMSMPVMVAIMSRFLLGEVVNAAKVGGIVLALAGVVVLVLWSSAGGELSVRSVGGAAVTALAPLSWAIYTVTSKPLVAKYHPLYLSTLALSLGTLMLTPFAIVPAIHDVAGLTLSDWGWLLFLGLGCTAFAYAIGF
jgi:drug/metabolite transporter (DMT)-like permease